jgi:hypothetical protein
MSWSSYTISKPRGEEANVVRIRNDSGKVNEGNINVGPDNFKNNGTFGESEQRYIILAFLIRESPKFVEWSGRIENGELRTT